MIEIIYVCVATLSAVKIEAAFRGYLKDCNQPLSQRTTPLSRY